MFTILNSNGGLTDCGLHVYCCIFFPFLKDNSIELFVMNSNIFAQVDSESSHNYLIADSLILLFCVQDMPILEIGIEGNSRSFSC